MSFIQQVLEVANPRGRCNRKALLGIALALLSIQALAVLVHWLSQSPIVHTAATVVELGCLWIATSAAIKRLHDLGRTGWWVPGFLLALFVWTLLVSFGSFLTMGDAVTQIGSPQFIIHVCVVMVPPVAATIWLHFAPGNPGRNKYGPEPDETGLASPQGNLIHRDSINGQIA
ncbi:MAG: DUF805 domain-containing protein [Alphaproteobacteria bacterium]|nr:DUF805 domain-containing protein [Alphaproteobacteria bacterium]